MKLETKGTEGIEHWNLVEFLSKFEEIKVLHSFDSSVQEDFMGFYLGISKGDFEKRFDLRCLPIASKEENEHMLMAVYGHPIPNLNGKWNGEKLPLKLSNGTKKSCTEVLQNLEARMKDDGHAKKLLG